MEDRARREDEDWAFPRKCPPYCVGLKFGILGWETNTKV
jgi:hypothetical protein